jgi:hypothetical protein
MIKYILKFILMWTLAAIIYVLAVTYARAEAWSMPNQAGGKIVITDRKCPNFTYLSEAYTYAADGSVIKSCWAVIDGAIHVVYYNGKERVYSISLFSPETSM